MYTYILHNIYIEIMYISISTYIIYIYCMYVTPPVYRTLPPPTSLGKYPSGNGSTQRKVRPRGGDLRIQSLTPVTFSGRLSNGELLRKNRASC